MNRPRARPLIETIFIIAIGIGALILVNNFAAGTCLVSLVLLVYIVAAL